MSWSSLPRSHFPLIILAWTSILVHFLIIIVIRKFRKRNQLYQNPYITLALAQSIPSIMLLLHVELLVRPREFGLFQLFRASTNSKLAAILLGLQTAQKSQLIIFQIPFALNLAFTAFVATLSYHKIWSLPTIALAITLPLSVPVAFVAIPVQYNVSFVASGDGINLQTPSECMAILSIAAQSCSVLTIIICVPLYAVAAYHSRKTYAYAHNPHIVKQERIHLICALVSFGVIILDSIRAALLIISTFQHPIDFALYEAVMPYWYHTTELMCCVQPWVMLVGNVHIRRNLLYLLFNINPTPVNPAPHSDKSISLILIAPTPLMRAPQPAYF
ncbi:hypothetical protein PRIPAC_75503 [Pristionchus pacificus]|uniref:Uncharacterized protein n=1 Tax=Pristionchus pacificus TaxID=54126 RepID=A0A2A6B4D2_PRIPA|nr:hypothetical protein PRIPAC_75503 [Pristionchus pacificus]|eukprot:PDM60745.1 hypothetical protein PRIPAC_54551 [Pristionchus pacificus]